MRAELQVLKARKAEKDCREEAAAEKRWVAEAERLKEEALAAEVAALKERLFWGYGQDLAMICLQQLGISDAFPTCS